MGNLLAIEFGVLTPRPALVFLSDKLVQNIQNQLPNNIKLRGGMGAGCEYLPDLKPLLSDAKFTNDLHSQATLIYALDLFLANPDRRIGKPNCGLLQDSLLAYDFECCFSFVFSLPAFSPKPWELSKLGIAKHHIFHRELAARGAQWSSFMDKMEQLDERRLRELVKDLPISWMSNATRVFDHLLEAQEQSQKLILELESSLHL